MDMPLMLINDDNGIIMDEKPTLVVGCQRSGTSIVAGMLFYSGVYMGDWFLKKDKHNPTGYFEDIDFGNLDEDRWKGGITEEQWTEKINELIERRSQEIYGFPRWGWKNPASALFIEDYIKLCNPYIIHCTRDKEDTFRSMKKMYWQKPEKQYTEKIEQIEKVERLQVDFNNLIENTEYELGRIMGYINYTPPPGKLKKALNHIVKEPNLNNQQKEHYQTYL